MQIKEIEELIERLRDFQIGWEDDPPQPESHAARYVELTKGHYSQAVSALTQLLDQVKWRPIESADKSQEILALSKSWEGGLRPILLRWFKYNGTEAWRDWDHDPHYPDLYLPLPPLPESRDADA